MRKKRNLKSWQPRLQDRITAVTYKEINSNMRLIKFRAGKAMPAGARPELAKRAGPATFRRELHRNIARAAYKRKAPLAVFRQAGRESSGDLLSRIRGPGTIGDARLNFRVRDGNGCDPRSITAETISLAWNLNFYCNLQGTEARRVRAAHADRRTESLKERKSVSRAISTARLNVSPRLHLRPIDVVVSDGPSGGCPRET